ncbi:MAG: hypothetical protein A4E53_00419 [Pelotomaculum sp. PtaB.Bin104]|nr:MAG: hypothetical protein A4E53_00419 [Pelotomaculum sp. PtaB.Bin104]
MPKFNIDDYLPVETYRDCLSAFHAISGLILFEFARENANTRDIIIRNFIARSDMMTRSVFTLWDLHAYQDCWIIHRCLIDRLFHLWQLQQSDEFEVFEAWSFFEQFKAVNRVRSDPEFSGALNSKFFEITPEQKVRASAIQKNPPIWRRPKAEDAAKGLDMGFLYRFGYDFASSHIHPMANDGQQDFYTITKLEPVPDFPEHRVVLSNSLLIATMLVQQGLNSSTLSWRSLVYDFFDDLRRMLGTGSEEYKISFLKLGKMIEHVECS